MALKDQPYIPLYIKDVITDEKLKECNAASHGVYFLLICLLHKQPEYGKLLLKQKYKQNESKYHDFACLLARHFPFDLLTIELALKELHQEDVIQIDGDILSQKRMVRDAELSEKRANAGRRGGKTLQNRIASNGNFANDFAKAKSKATTEYVNANEIVNEIENKGVVKKGVQGEKWKQQIGHLPNFQNDAFYQAWTNWENYLAEHRQSPKLLTDTGRLMAITDLYNISGDDCGAAIATIQHSIKNNWVTLHPPTTDKPKGKTKASTEELEAIASKYIQKRTS